MPAFMAGAYAIYLFIMVTDTFNNFIQPPKRGGTLLKGDFFEDFTTRKMIGPCIPPTALKKLKEMSDDAVRKADRSTFDYIQWIMNPKGVWGFTGQAELERSAEILYWTEVVKVVLSRASINTKVRSPFREVALVYRHPYYSTVVGLNEDPQAIAAFTNFSFLVSAFNVKGSINYDKGFFQKIIKAFDDLCVVLANTRYETIKAPTLEDWGIIRAEKTLTYRL